MQYSNIPLAQTVVAYCEAYGIEHIVISPGSRNAPLTIGFTHNNFFKCYSIVDERCAAFFALGIAQQLKKPVALVCTSGSALLNYYPAISEAFFSHIPLMVLSADRPEDRIGIGDGQTIFQAGVYGKHIVAEANLSSNNSKETFENNAKAIKELMETCRTVKGPVHLNIPFKEPLYGKTDRLLITPPFVGLASLPKFSKNDQQDRFIKAWNGAQRKMILVGVLDPEELDEKSLQLLAEDESVLVFTESTSNLYDNNFFPSIDKIIAPLDVEAFEALQPDLLVTMGGLVVSKKIKAFLREYPANQHWHIGTNTANDTFFYLTEHVITVPKLWFQALAPKLSAISSNYKAYWERVKVSRREKHEMYMASIPYSDLLVFHYLLKHIPKHMHVQMSNSSTIRYAQLFNWDSTIEMFCNRGTSGIDGSTSTAIGAALIQSKPTLFVTGDLSFFYDSNALWNNYIPKNFKILLINNGGGGIFRILPGHKNTENFDTYFETKHQLTARQLCDMYGIEYQSVKLENTLETQLKLFFKTDSNPVLLEVFTPSSINDEVLLNYFEYLK